MSNELLCDIKARLNGIKKQPTGETVGSEDCLVDIFTKSDLKACTGVCLKCKCRITLGKFNNKSSQSLTPNSNDDTHHL